MEFRASLFRPVEAALPTWRFIRGIVRSVSDFAAIIWTEMDLELEIVRGRNCGLPEPVPDLEVVVQQHTFILPRTATARNNSGLAARRGLHR
jgi:hypothetical protein